MPIKTVAAIAESFGLRLLCVRPMHDHILGMTRDGEMDALRETMQVAGAAAPEKTVSEAEWRAIGLYCVAVWQKFT